MNYREIVPIPFWLPNLPLEASRIVLYNFHNYNFDGTDATVSYRLEGVPVSDEYIGTNPPLRLLYEGSVTIPNEIVQNWGEDDEPIFQYVIDVLGLVRAEGE